MDGLAWRKIVGQSVGNASAGLPLPILGSAAAHTDAGVFG